MIMNVTQLDEDLMALQEMRSAIKAAKEAQAIYQTFTQEQVDKIVKHVAEGAFKESARLGAMAVDETGMGVKEHKKIKNEVASMAVYESIKDLRTVGIIRDDPKNQMIEIADPYGVILGIIPTTNPTSTAIFKSLIALKTRNALVVSPHPYAIECTKEALRICHDLAVEAGAPSGLLQIMTKSSIKVTKQAMEHPDVDLILATGGGALVKAAYSSGKPAYGVGPGNVPVYVERTANIEKAVKNIVDSKSFDNGTICATEQALVVDAHIETIFLQKLKTHGAYILSNDEKEKLEKVISPVAGRVNPEIVGKSAHFIAQKAGFEVPDNTKIIVGIETKIGKEVPFSLEKLAPIFAFYRAEDSNDAKKICLDLLDLGGRGHSLSIHTESESIVRDFAVEMPVSRILVNTMSSVGAVGGTTNLMPSMTLGCGSYGGNITSDNVTAKHLINIKRVAYGVKDVHLPEINTQTSEQYVVNKETNHHEKESKIDSELVERLVKEIIKEFK